MYLYNIAFPFSFSISFSALTSLHISNTCESFDFTTSFKMSSRYSSNVLYGSTTVSSTSSTPQSSSRSSSTDGPIITTYRTPESTGDRGPVYTVSRGSTSVHNQQARLNALGEPRSSDASYEDKNHSSSKRSSKSSKLSR